MVQLRGSHADRQAHPFLGDGHRGGQLVRELDGHALDGVALHTEQQDGELVTPEARRAIAGAQPRRQRVAQRAQHFVAGQVAEHVVDLLEAVDVHQHERGVLAVAPATLELLGEVLLEAAPVPQSRQRIAVGEVEQVRLEVLAHGDVRA